MGLIQRDVPMELARKSLEAMHKKVTLFYDQLYDSSYQLPRLELENWTLNYIFSGKYFGEGAGVPLGRMINLFGPESSGKSALYLMIAGEIIKKGGRVCWIDAERSVDPDYFMKFGIDIFDEDHFIVGIPDFGEHAMDMAEQFVKSGAIDACFIDSVTALQPQKVFEASNERDDVASLARKLSTHLGKMVKMAADAQCIVGYVNQMRTNLTAMGAFGEKSTGGNAKIIGL